MTHVRLSHPWKWHKALDVLEVGVDLDAATAGQLIRAGYAVDVDTLLEDQGGGWVGVTLSDGNPVKVRGRDKALRRLRKDSGQW